MALLACQHRPAPLLLAVAAVLLGSCRPAASPPGQPLTGYGSAQGYIAASCTTGSVGQAADGSRAWYFLPDTLKHDDTAPAIIFLHGHSATDPNLYQGHITHLVRQGYIVVYPQFQLTGAGAAWQDLDQNRMLDRAIEATDRVFALLDDRIERDAVTLYGHSLGGLLALCWHGAGGVRARRIVTANANLDPSTGIPPAVMPLITLIDYTDERYLPKIRVPVVMLWGCDDTNIAPLAQQYEALSLLTRASRTALYAAQSDDHGRPPLVADHAAPCQPQLRGRPQEDTIDFRFYYAALDAALDDAVAMEFSMGAWSDATPVARIIKLWP